MLRGSNGFVRVELELSPHVPPRVQRYECESVLPLSAERAASLAKLCATAGDSGAPTSLISPNADHAALWAELRRIVDRCGVCEPGEVQKYEGDDEVVVCWLGRGFTVELTVVFDDGGVLSIQANITARPRSFADD